MLLKDDKKKLVTMILSRPRYKSEESCEHMDPSKDMEYSEKKEKDGAFLDKDMAYESIAKDMMECIKSGDTKKFKQCLYDFVSMVAEDQDDD